LANELKRCAAILEGGLNGAYNQQGVRKPRPKQHPLLKKTLRKEKDRLRNIEKRRAMTQDQKNKVKEKGRLRWSLQSNKVKEEGRLRKKQKRQDMTQNHKPVAGVQVQTT
jgi:hypothetical protein